MTQDFAPICANTGLRAAERKAKIIAAARRLFIENGFHATGVAQIARESGVAVGQLYRDFASKEAIIESIVMQDSSGFLIRGGIERCIASRDEEAVWQWLCAFLEPDPAFSHVLMIEIIAEAARNPKVAAIFEVCHDNMRTGLLRAIEVLMPGEATGEARETVVDMVLMLSLGLLQHEAMRGQAETRRLAQVAFASLRSQILALKNLHRADAPGNQECCAADERRVSENG